MEAAAVKSRKPAFIAALLLVAGLLVSASKSPTREECQAFIERESQQRCQTTLSSAWTWLQDMLFAEGRYMRMRDEAIAKREHDLVRKKVERGELPREALNQRSYKSAVQQQTTQQQQRQPSLLTRIWNELFAESRYIQQRNEAIAARQRDLEQVKHDRGDSRHESDKTPLKKTKANIAQKPSSTKATPPKPLKPVSTAKKVSADPRRLYTTTTTATTTTTSKNNWLYDIVFAEANYMKLRDEAIENRQRDLIKTKIARGELPEKALDSKTWSVTPKKHFLGVSKDYDDEEAQNQERAHSLWDMIFSERRLMEIRRKAMTERQLDLIRTKVERGELPQEALENPELYDTETSGEDEDEEQLSLWDMIFSEARLMRIRQKAMTERKRDLIRQKVESGQLPREALEWNPEEIDNEDADTGFFPSLWDAIFADGRHYEIRQQALAERRMDLIRTKVERGELPPETLEEAYADMDKLYDTDDQGDGQQSILARIWNELFAESRYWEQRNKAIAEREADLRRLKMAQAGHADIERKWSRLEKHVLQKKPTESDKFQQRQTNIGTKKHFRSTTSSKKDNPQAQHAIKNKNVYIKEKIPKIAKDKSKTQAFIKQTKAKPSQTGVPNTQVNQYNDDKQIQEKNTEHRYQETTDSITKVSRTSEVYSKSHNYDNNKHVSGEHDKLYSRDTRPYNENVDEDSSDVSDESSESDDNDDTDEDSGTSDDSSESDDGEQDGEDSDDIIGAADDEGTENGDGGWYNEYGASIDGDKSDRSNRGRHIWRNAEFSEKIKYRSKYGRNAGMDGEAAMSSDLTVTKADRQLKTPTMPLKKKSQPVSSQHKQKAAAIKPSPETTRTPEKTVISSQTPSAKTPTSTTKTKPNRQPVDKPQPATTTHVPTVQSPAYQPPPPHAEPTVRSRQQVERLMGLNEPQMRAVDDAGAYTLRQLKGIADSCVRPLEELYKYSEISSRTLGEAELNAKSMLLFLGQLNSGKSTMINYLLGTQPTKTTALPGSGQFRILSYGERDEKQNGAQVASKWEFSGLQKFGEGFLERLSGRQMKNKLLEKANIVDVPGVMEGRQYNRLYPFNDVCQWLIDRADMIFVVFDPHHLDIGIEMENLLDQLKGRETQVRILLNKADQLAASDLLRVQTSLIWTLSPLIGSSTAPPIFSGSFIEHTAHSDTNHQLMFGSQEEALLRDIGSGLARRVANKIALTRRHAVRVRNHARMVDCYLTTYLNQITFLSNKKRLAEDIVGNPHKYHIYEGISRMNNISRYDLPDPELYEEFFAMHALYEFPTLQSTCTFFKGCPLDTLDTAIQHTLPDLLGQYRKTTAKSAPGAKRS